MTARKLAAIAEPHRRNPEPEEAFATDEPDHELYETGALLPGPDATLAGPTFEEWLDSEY